MLMIRGTWRVTTYLPNGWRASWDLQADGSLPTYGDAFRAAVKATDDLDVDLGESDLTKAALFASELAAKVPGCLAVAVTTADLNEQGYCAEVVRRG
jgi:hypothetical protein